MKNNFFDLIYRKVIFFYQNKILEKKNINKKDSRIYMFHDVSNKETNIVSFNSNIKWFENFCLNN